VRRRSLAWAGLALALFGLTCRDDRLTGPGGPAFAALDVSALVTLGPGDPPVPADSIQITFVRTDQSVALDTIRALAPAAQGDSFLLALDVPLIQTPEDLTLTLRAFGGGYDWYAGTSVVQLVAGATTPATVVPQYVGPGANADSVRIVLPSTRLVGGVAVTVAATVFGPGGPVAGVPVGFSVANDLVASVSGQQLDVATVTGTQPLRDSTWVIAEIPTHLRDSVRVAVVPPPAQIELVSGAGQSGSWGVPLPAPLVVRVLDALGGPFAGDTVVWSVSAGTATLSATTTITDSLGEASVTVTPGAPGTLAVQAAAAGLAGSPQTFSITVAGGSGIAIVSGDAQADTVGATLAPFVVRVADAADNPLAGEQVDWTRVAGSGTVSAGATTTDTSGLTQISYTLGSVPGTDTVRATLTSSGASVEFTATAAVAAVASVTIDRTLDTIPKGTTLQYTATLRDAQGNPVPGSATWSSSAPSVASVNATGLALGVAGGFARIIATAGSHADTADLYVRALSSIAVHPADTVVTAVYDSLFLSATALSNFGDTIVSGVVIHYTSATPSVAAVDALTGKVYALGPGNAVVLARDTVSGIQGAATVRVNQVPVAVVNTPADSIQVGVGGRGQIVARALDRNDYPIPDRTFGWTTRAPAIATVDQAGGVTGVALGQTWAVDSLVDSAGVFKDSTLVSVVTLPPAIVQWAYDSTAIGNGSNLAVAVSLTRPSTLPVVVRMVSSDSFVAKPSTPFVTIPANTPGTSATILGVAAGQTEIVVVDTAGVYLPDTMVVTVVSTIEFREIGSFNRQPNFYVNNNQTYRAQVFLSDPAPPGGLGVTFEYGAPGRSVVSPSPAIIPAGQLAADVVIQGLDAGRDSVVPTSGGFVGKYSYVYVAPESLRLNLPWPYTGVLGVGQRFDPYVSYTYAMDHPQIVALDLTPALGTRPDTVTIATGTYYRYFTVGATTPGTATLTVSAPGWVPASATLTFTTPRLGAYGTTSIVAGDPSRGYWGVYTRDSTNVAQVVASPVVVSAVSRNPAAVEVEVATDTVPIGSSSVTASASLRALPTAGGDSAWIVLTAPGYEPDSIMVRVTPPTLTFALGWPYDGRLGLGTLYQNAAYVSIPYARPDTFWVELGHTRRGVLGGPDSVAIVPGQTYTYFGVRGDSLGPDTISVTRATGYVVNGGPFGFVVEPLRVRPYNYPTTLYTITAPQIVSAIAENSGNSVARPLLAPLTVDLTAGNPAAYTLASGSVTIPAGQYISGYDTLHVVGVDTVGSRILAAAPGALTDSSNLIRVLPTPLNVQIGWPYTVGQGLTLSGNRVYVTGGNVPDTVRVGLSHTNPGAFSLTRDTVLILPGQQYSEYFDIWALDSAGTDTIVAAAPGYVTNRGTVATQPSRLDVADPGPNHLTTEPPYRLVTYTETRAGHGLKPYQPVTFTIVSSDPNVIVIDSAATINLRGDTATSVVDTARTYGYFKVRFVGSGAARLRVSAPGFDTDSTYLITVTGPSLNFSYPTVTVGETQIFTSQRVYVNNAVASDLVVRLLRSDSLLPPASQAFVVSSDSVVIAAGQTYSPPFDITGNTIAAANLVARATGYSQAQSTVSVGQPVLTAGVQAVTMYVGERPGGIGINTRDQANQVRIVAAPLTVSVASSDASVAIPDSAARTIAARQNFTAFNIRPLEKGSVDIVYTAPGYVADTTVITVDTAKLILGNPPNGLGVGQVAVNQMYVDIPYVTDSALIVSLQSTNPGVLTVPDTVIIGAGQTFRYFNVTGVGKGFASIIATAPRSHPDTLGVRVSQPRLTVSLGAATNAGQRYTMTIFARDSLNVVRTVSAPLTVTLASSDPGHTTLDSLTTTIAAGQSSVTMGVAFDTAGSYTITARAAGYDDGTAVTTTTGALVRMVSGNQFVPATVVIPAGRMVTWRNDDAVTHTTTEDSATPLWNASRAPGQTYARTFSTAGTFTYHCSIHAGMTGTVIVQ